MYGLRTVRRNNDVLGIFMHGASTLLGIVLILAGMLMAVTMILMPLGIGLMAVGVLALMWGVDDIPDGRERPNEPPTKPMPPVDKAA